MLILLAIIVASVIGAGSISDYDFHRLSDPRKSKDANYF